jgi:hypothetical protein
MADYLAQRRRWQSNEWSGQVVVIASDEYVCSMDSLELARYQRPKEPERLLRGQAAIPE